MSAASFGIGIPLVMFGALGLLWQSGNHGACSTSLGQALAAQDCAAVSVIWTAALLAVVIGVVLIIAGAIMRGRS